MKIIAGISNTINENEIKAYIDAGVDEFFVGYIPAALGIIKYYKCLIII